MKKFIIIVTIIFLGVIGYIVYVEKEKDKIEPLKIELEQAKITDYYIYGTRLNLTGELSLENLEFDEVDLVLYNNVNFICYEINYTKDLNTLSFNTSTLINEGINLDKIEKDDYQILLRLKTIIPPTEENEEEIITYKYYNLRNETEYSETTYYTLSKYNNKVLISTKDNILSLNIKENEENEIYDIVIDPGHGGIDPGAVKNEKTEKDYTLSFAQTLKEKLENYGFKVKLTRDETTLSEDEYFDEYGKNGRAEISHEVSAKYLISLHLNSNTYSKINGIELYTPGNINYTLAQKLVENIKNKTSLNYSTQKTYRMYNGIYTHNFSEAEILESQNKEQSRGRAPYDITTSSNYLYMIRETGGIMTGAYVDNRNEEQTANTYCNSNIGTESYLLEMAYLSNESDIKIIETEKEEYMEAIAITFKEYLDY